MANWIHENKGSGNSSGATYDGVDFENNTFWDSATDSWEGYALPSSIVWTHEIKH